MITPCIPANNGQASEPTDLPGASPGSMSRFNLWHAAVPLRSSGDTILNFSEIGMVSPNWGLLIRYDKHDVNYLGLIQLACALLWYRRVYRLQAA